MARLYIRMDLGLADDGGIEARRVTFGARIAHERARTAPDEQALKVQIIQEKINLGGLIRTPAKEVVAETEGFEPSVPHSQHDGLANRWFQPLTHVSAWSAALTTGWPRRVAIAMHFAPRNGKD